MTVEVLLVAALATWRITSFFIYEDGPLDIFSKFRSLSRRIGGEVQRAMECPWCFSVWAGLLCALLSRSEYWWLMLPFALSGAAMAVEMYVRNNARSR